MLTYSPVVRAAGPRILFLVGATLTVGMLLWMHQMRLSGNLHGLTNIFFVLFVYQDYEAAGCALLILMAAVFVPGSAPLRGVFRWAGNHPVVIAGLSLVVLCAGAAWAYHNHPLSMDEYAPYFQSRVFANGHITGKWPLPQLDWLLPPGFQSVFLNVSHTTGRVTSAYWPAFALILTPFMWAGIPWACNPVISAVTLLAVHRLALRIFADREAAGVALLLTASSPVFFGIGISYYSMPAHLLINTVFVLLLTRPTVGRAITAGVVGSIALTLHNPVPHILFAVPWLLWVLSRAGGLRLFGALCLGYLPLCALLGVGWFWFSTNLAHEGIPAASGAAGGLENVSAVFGLPTGTLFLARLIGVAKVWVWAVPGILLLACVGARRWSSDTTCRLLALSAATTFVGYFFVTADQGHGWGFRYFHSTWMALPLLATAAMFPPAPGDRASDAVQSTRISRLFEDVDTRAYLAVCTVLTLVFGVLLRAWQIQDFMAADLKQLPQYQGTEPQVVIVDPTLSFYGADLVQNDPWLRGNVIRLYSHGRTADRELMAEYYPAMHQVFADHHGWVWSARSLSSPSGTDKPRESH